LSTGVYKIIIIITIINNDIIWRASGAAGILAVKEPSGLDRQDGKRPDGLTLVPRHGGRSLVRDVSRQPIFTSPPIGGQNIVKVKVNGV